MLKKHVFFCIALLFIVLDSCWAQAIKDTPFLEIEDRVLILAPHPDDETIGTAGVLQQAKKAGAQVKVVCFTNGDANELAFIV